LTDIQADNAAVDADEPSTGGGSKRVAPAVVVVVALVLGVLFWILITAERGDSESASTPLLNRLAPDSGGLLEDGRPFELSRRKGSWVVLNFFTHDCVPCIREHSELVEFVEQQRALGPDGAEFYSIVQHSTVEEVNEFFARWGGDWPVVFDDQFEFQNDFGVAQVPETWVIDPNGLVRGRVISEVSADRLSIDLQRLREQG
jgi:cytochrome c biogenesis protein CcmG, thiol:disulfide interchange protein DsbE